MPAFPFPPDFIFGCAAASYQIEGAHDADGKGPSIWDAFCRRPGAILNGDSGDTACDHYHRWEQDLDMIAALGLDAYRFSVAWPRILPEGTGRVNEAGLDFYERLVDGMLARGIKPVLTLYHWDLPLALEEKHGGWRSRVTAEAFAEYARLVAERLGDRVPYWTTFNEMPVFAELGYRAGIHAPGLKLDEKGVRTVIHNILLAHGLGVQALRAALPAQSKIGVVHNPWACVPFVENDACIKAARQRWEYRNSWYLDPMFKGSYPGGQIEELGAAMPEIRDGDMRAIHQPLDFLGLNIYSSQAVVEEDGTERAYEKDFPSTDMGWHITPDVLYWALRFAHDLYAPPELLITENGCAFDGQVNAEGRVEDYARLEYMRGYLRGVQRAVSEGLPAKGYFAWSILDNFEWSFGYARRFGIVHVNFETQQRTLKESAKWYSHVAKNRGM
ncbi:MAG: beta-glucosidase [Candidatus Sumerlaeota bacterium]|nr:beta-glucosidase [Candidatus Sumerlaeota bacterium]